MKKKLIRVTTECGSLWSLLRGQLGFMNQNGFDVIGVGSPGRRVEQLETCEGIRIDPIKMTRKISPFRDLTSLWKMYKFLKKENPEIVHTHTPKAGIIGMLAARLAKVPVRIHTVAGLPLMEATGFKKALLRWVEKLTYSSATMVFPNSQGLWRYILKEGLAPPTKLKVLGKGSSNGIDTDYFSPDSIEESQKSELRKALGLNKKDFIFVFLGRLVGDKGINELVNAFLAISPHPTIKPERLTPLDKSENVSFKLLLVGPKEEQLDPLFPGTDRQIKENPNIIWVGFQEDVRPYFSISDVLVFPSYREGFPNVVMQAGAMRLPSIVSDINGCNEIIVEDLNGLIIPPKDVQALIEAMKKLYSDTKLRNKLASNAREMIVSRYNQRSLWEELLNEYQTLLNAAEK